MVTIIINVVVNVAIVIISWLLHGINCLAKQKLGALAHTSHAQYIYVTGNPKNVRHFMKWQKAIGNTRNA